MAAKKAQERPVGRQARMAAWTRQTVCCDCGSERSVRKDNPALRCVPCAARVRGAKGLAAIRAKAIPRQPKPKIARRVERTCRACSGQFSVPRSKLSGKTNSSANFCCRPCYNGWLAQTPVDHHRGPRWKKVARAAKALAPFCAWCGTRRGRLEVHHIVPFRLTHDNSPENLIPLCASCHKRIETTVKIVEAGGAPLQTLPYLGSVLRHRQAATARLLSRLRHEAQRC